MGESKRKKMNSKADRLASQYTQGIPVESMVQMMDSMLEHCHRNDVAMKSMSAAEQAKHMRAVFDSSHMVLGMWKDGRGGYGATIMKSEIDEVAAGHLMAAANGNGVAMVTAFFTEDDEEAEALGMFYSMLGRGMGVHAEGLWECAMPALREERHASIRHLEAGYAARRQARGAR